jgi:hypothetical protein
MGKVKCWDENRETEWKLWPVACFTYESLEPCYLNLLPLPTPCYVRNFILPKFQCWSLNIQCDFTWRWSFQEVKLNLVIKVWGGVLIQQDWWLSKRKRKK